MNLPVAQAVCSEAELRVLLSLVLHAALQIPLYKAINECIELECKIMRIAPSRKECRVMFYQDEGGRTKRPGRPPLHAEHSDAREI